MMSEHQKHTEFLRHCLRYGESTEHQKLEEGLTQVQRDARCVRRAVWLMAILTALVVAGLGYGTVLVANFPYNAPQAIVNLIYALGLGALISLVVFAGLGLVYRWKLDQRREECRQQVARLLESRLGKPVATSWRDNLVSDGSLGTAQIAAGGNGSSVTIASIARG
jgi:type VI protein secretion system component VasF